MCRQLDDQLLGLQCSYGPLVGLEHFEQGLGRLFEALGPCTCNGAQWYSHLVFTISFCAHISSVVNWAEYLSTKLDSSLTRARSIRRTSFEMCSDSARQMGHVARVRARAWLVFHKRAESSSSCQLIPLNVYNFHFLCFWIVKCIYTLPYRAY